MSTTVLDSIKKVRDFMLEIFNKTAALLDKTSRANLLLALALCFYTEYWGKLVTENKLKPTDSFNTLLYNPRFLL